MEVIEFGTSESREERGLAGSRSFRISVSESREPSSPGVSAPRGFRFSTFRNFGVSESGNLAGFVGFSESQSFGATFRLFGISESRTLGVSET